MVRFALATALALVVVVSGLKAQQSGSGGGGNYVTVWYDDLIGYGGTGDRTFGPFSSPDEVTAFEQKWAKDHPDDLRLFKSREARVRVTPPRPPSASPPAINVPRVPPPGGGRA